VCAGDADEGLEPIRFRPGHLQAERRQPVVPAPFVVELGRGTLVAFLDQPLFDHPLNRTVERTGAHAHRTVGSRSDFQNDGVAVPIRDYTRTMVGSLAVVGPGHRLTDEAIHSKIAPALLKAGNELSKRLGYPGSETKLPAR